MRGVASNVPVLPAGSAAATPSDGRRGGDGGEDRDRDRDDGGVGDRRRTEVKRQRRQEREKHAVVLDEIAPKETGRQAVAVRKRASHDSGPVVFRSRPLACPYSVMINRCIVRVAAMCSTCAPSMSSP